MSTPDSALQQRVLEELMWEPSINAAHIGVAAESHVVTLTGAVPSYYQKVAAERAAARVLGVHALANEIEVVFLGAPKLGDADVAGAALVALRQSVSVPEGTIEVAVSHGIVTLRGGVEWGAEREAAEGAVHDLVGVIDVVNLIDIKPHPSRTLVEESIESAFQRNAVLDARHIDIEINDGTITLRGAVQSLQESREAERAAWAAPGAREVKNQLVVGG
jgi:osmotically-inducible protein OsmY